MSPGRRFDYLDDYCWRLTDVSICWAAADGSVNADDEDMSWYHDGTTPDTVNYYHPVLSNPTTGELMDTPSDQHTNSYDFHVGFFLGYDSVRGKLIWISGNYANRIAIADHPHSEDTPDPADSYDPLTYDSTDPADWASYQGRPHTNHIGRLKPEMFGYQY